MIAPRVFSPSEAAVVSGVGVKAIHNAIDKRSLSGVETPDTAGRRATRRLTGADLVRIKLWYGIAAWLPSDRRRRLFEEIEAHPSADTIRADDLLLVDVAEARRQVVARIRDLEEAEAAIQGVRGVMGGEPVFLGTRIPVRLVTEMLADGVSEEEIVEGYPRLNSRLIRLAVLWVTANPRRGRPRGLKDQGCRLKSTRRVPMREAAPAPAEG